MEAVTRMLAYQTSRLRYDPAREGFETYPLPSKGGLIRHLALGARKG